MKLQIPSPEGPKKDDTELSDEIWITILFCVALIFVGWNFWVVPQREQEPDPLAHIEDLREREEVRDRQYFEEILEEGRFSVSNWEAEKRSRAFTSAPREINEQICVDQLDALKSGELDREENVALLRSINRASPNAPWTCLLRAYLREELPQEGELAVELGEFWEDVNSFADHGRIMRSVISDFRAERDRPESEKFYAWLRRCALDFDYPAAAQCQRVARQISPRQGSDMLELALLELEDPELNDEEIIHVADALARMSKNGQPQGWSVEETRLLPDYDVDFRIGALFVLCRMMNSPHRPLREEIIDRLAGLSSIAVRPTNPYMSYRWRNACQMAYGNPDEPQEPVPILSVFSGEGPTLDYSMNGVIDDGLCEVEEGTPKWFCGAQEWSSSTTRADAVIADFFALTSYVEWYELDELAELMPILTE